jgi:hypothetical protein
MRRTIQHCTLMAANREGRMGLIRRRRAALTRPQGGLLLARANIHTEANEKQRSTEGLMRQYCPGPGRKTPAGKPASE